MDPALNQTKGSNWNTQVISAWLVQLYLFRYAVYSVSNADTNPRQEWLDMGAPDCPTRSQELIIREVYHKTRNCHNFNEF